VKHQAQKGQVIGSAEIVRVSVSHRPDCVSEPVPTAAADSAEPDRSAAGWRGIVGHGHCLTAQQVRQIDRAAVDRFGLSGPLLMENAGRGGAEVIARHAPPGLPVVILCGPGNNGGDGWVIARHLHGSGWTVQTWLIGPPDRLTPDAALNIDIWQRSGGIVQAWSESQSAELDRQLAGCGAIVDCLLGTGASGPPRSPLESIVSAANRSPAIRIAIDVPTGLDADLGTVHPTCFLADLTCTFVALKPGLVTERGKAVSGRIVVLPIGLAQLPTRTTDF
jgi:NAD(P)H-hydrate epimerase